MYRIREPNQNWEETEAHMETNKGKETMGDREEISFNNLISALNDLVKGQKEIMEFIGRLAKKRLCNQNKHQNKQNNNGEGGSNCGNKIHSLTNMQSHPHLYSK